MLRSLGAQMIFAPWHSRTLQIPALASFDHHPDYIAKDPSQSVDIGAGEDSEKAAAETRVT